jgi:hypothetical protein
MGRGRVRGGLCTIFTLPFIRLRRISSPPLRVLDRQERGILLLVKGCSFIYSKILFDLHVNDSF